MKKIRKILALALAIFMLAGLMPTNVFADDTRTKINDIVATSDDIDGIPAYGGQVKAPTFTVTKGSPAYFNVEGNGDWCKKEGGKWKQYREKTFTEGTYRYEVQIRIDGEAGTTHVLDKNGVTVTVDGRKWADNERPSVADTFSYAWAKSKEYVISKTAQEKLVDIPKANINLIYNATEQTGVNEGTGYTITGNTATNAGAYTAKATLKEGYKWKDGTKEVKNIPFEIEKADPTYTVPTGLKGKKDKKLSTVTLPSGFTWVDGETVLNTVGENTFKAKFTPADTTNYEVIDVDLTVKVEDVVTPPEKVTLTTNIINGHGTVTVTPASATVDKGNTIVVTFNPETNYEIDTVTLDGTDVKPQVVSNKLTITMDKSKTLWVGFKEKPITPPPTPVTYTLTASVDGGHGTVSPTTKTVNKDETVTLTFAPEANYEIEEVKVNGTATTVSGNSLVITMNEDKTVVVKYKEKAPEPPTPEEKVTITFDANGGTGTMADVTKTKGESFTLPACTFTPPAGKEFKAWQVDGTEKNVGDKIVLNGDKNIKAVWKDIGSLPPTPPTPYTPYPWTVYPGWYYNFEPPKAKEEKPATKMEMDWKIELAIGISTIDRKINGADSKIKMDVAPYIRDGRTMLPIRSVAEALGFEVEWNKSTRTVVLKDNTTRVEIPVDTNKIIVNGTVYTSDVKPEIKNNRTMLPIANIARALGLKDGKDIIWNSKSKTVTIYRSILVK